MPAAEQPRKKPLCDEARLSVLVRAWQRAPPDLKDEWWREFVNESAAWIMAIVCSFKTDLSGIGSYEDVRSEIFLHLHNKVLSAYRHGKGRLFSLITFSTQNYIRTLLERQRRLSQHYLVLEEDDLQRQSATLPEVYGLATEIRQRLDHFTARGKDGFDFFITRNLVVECYWREGGLGGVSPSVEQIALIVQRIVALPADLALAQTRRALLLLQKELADFRGRPSLYRAEAGTDRLLECLPLEQAPSPSQAEAFDFSWQ